MPKARRIHARDGSRTPGDRRHEPTSPLEAKSDNKSCTESVTACRAAPPDRPRDVEALRR